MPYEINRLPSSSFIVRPQSKPYDTRSSCKRYTLASVPIVYQNKSEDQHFSTDVYIPRPTSQNLPKISATGILRRISVICTPPSPICLLVVRGHQDSQTRGRILYAHLVALATTPCEDGSDKNIHHLPWSTSPRLDLEHD